MRRLKTIAILTCAALLMSLSSCGIFKKDCGCPHFGKIKTMGNDMSQTA